MLTLFSSTHNETYTGKVMWHTKEHISTLRWLKKSILK